MEDKIKSGQEIVADFFDNIEQIPGVDVKIAGILKDLYENKDLTYKSLPNALLHLRKSEEAGSE